MSSWNAKKMAQNQRGRAGCAGEMRVFTQKCGAPHHFFWVEIANENADTHFGVSTPFVKNKEFEQKSVKYVKPWNEIVNARLKRMGCGGKWSKAYQKQSRRGVMSTSQKRKFRTLFWVCTSRESAKKQSEILKAVGNKLFTLFFWGGRC